MPPENYKEILEESIIIGVETADGVWTMPPEEIGRVRELRRIAREEATLKEMKAMLSELIERLEFERKPSLVKEYCNTRNHCSKACIFGDIYYCPYSGNDEKIDRLVEMKMNLTDAIECREQNK